MSMFLKPNSVPETLGKSIHFPILCELAKVIPYDFISPLKDGFEARAVKDFDHGAEIRGRVTCEPSSRDHRFFWLTFFGSVTVSELCQKIEEWTEGTPNHMIMVHCQDGLVYFKCDQS